MNRQDAHAWIDNTHVELMDLAEASRREVRRLLDAGEIKNYSKLTVAIRRAYMGPILAELSRLTKEAKAVDVDEIVQEFGLDPEEDEVLGGEAWIGC